MPDFEHSDDVNLPEVLEIYSTCVRQLRESGSTDFGRFCEDQKEKGRSRPLPFQAGSLRQVGRAAERPCEPQVISY